MGSKSTRDAVCIRKGTVLFVYSVYPVERHFTDVGLVPISDPGFFRNICPESVCKFDIKVLKVLLLCCVCR